MIPSHQVEIQSCVAITANNMQALRYFCLTWQHAARAHVLFLSTAGSPCSTTDYVTHLAKVALASLAPLAFEEVTFWEATRSTGPNLEFRRVAFTWSEGVLCAPVWWLAPDIPLSLSREAEAVVCEERDNWRRS